MRFFWRFLKDDSGATALEYCVIGAFMSILIVAGARAVGSNINNMFYAKLANSLS
ncbi:MAG: Flp family type IVb pilin [Hyphomicrobiales bacterium]|nr:Flp family type IVb pilin [Hyphomicrobiales bacterium]